MQVTAGGKLFNVVVDSENTGKQLLQNGDLRRRVTIIPLNKIQPHTVPTRIQQAAIRLVSCSFCLYSMFFFKKIFFLLLNPCPILCFDFIIIFVGW